MSAQPEVAADLTCLMRGYVYDGLYLDLYGYADEDDGCSVEAVTLAGSKVDISGLLTLAQMSKMGWAVDRAGVEARAKSRDENRAERAVWNMAAA